MATPLPETGDNVKEEELTSNEQHAESSLGGDENYVHTHSESQTVGGHLLWHAFHGSSCASDIPRQTWSNDYKLDNVYSSKQAQ